MYTHNSLIDPVIATYTSLRECMQVPLHFREKYVLALTGQLYVKV